MKNKLLLSVIVALLAIIICIPIWILIVQAVCPPEDARNISLFLQPVRLITTPDLQQFRTMIARHPDTWKYLSRDILYCAVSALVQCFIANLGGFLLAKYHGLFLKWLTTLYACSLLIPLQLYLIPAHQTIREIGWNESSVLMYFTVAFSPFGALMMRQVYRQVLPDEWIELFRMEDGRFGQLCRIVVFPAGFPASCVLYLISFAEGWNMIEQPLYLISDTRLHPIAFRLYNLYISEPDVICSAAMLALIPIPLLILIILWLAFRPAFSIEKHRFRGPYSCEASAAWVWIQSRD